MKVVQGVTTYWRGEPLKRKVQSELGDERPAKKQKKKQKKKHRRFTAPVTDEVEEDLQRYVQALEEESKTAPKFVRPDPILPDAMDIDTEPPTSPHPQSQPLEVSATAAAAFASTSGMLSKRAGAAKPPHSSETISQPHEKQPMPPPPFIPSYRPPSNPTKTKIIAWKISPNHRSLSYLISQPGSAKPPL